eukprot:5011507-Prymnesium_polylepis.4
MRAESTLTCAALSPFNVAPPKCTKAIDSISFMVSFDTSPCSFCSLMHASGAFSMSSFVSSDTFAAFSAAVSLLISANDAVRCSWFFRRAIRSGSLAMPDWPLTLPRLSSLRAAIACFAPSPCACFAISCIV